MSPRISIVLWVPLCLVLELGTQEAVIAQESLGLERGDLLRIRSLDVAGEYEFVRWDEGDLILSGGAEPTSEVAVRRGTFCSVEVGTPRSRLSAMGRNALRGFLILGSIGGVVGLISGVSNPWWGGNAFSAAVVVGGLLGTPAAIIGGFLGLASPGSTWRSIDLARAPEIGPVPSFC
jgi:hypothetical protein